MRCVRIQYGGVSHDRARPCRRPVVAEPPGEGGAMRTRIFTGRLRRVAWLGTLGALLAVLAVPFLGASSALAYPGFTVSATCTATNGQSGSNATWEWWQGGVGGGGALLAIGTVAGPDSVGRGTRRATGSGIQPDGGDTPAVFVGGGRSDRFWGSR